MFFKNQRLEKKANDGSKLIKDYGDKVGRGIQKRLRDLKSFDNLSDLPVTPPFNRHKLEGKYRKCFSVDVLGRRDPNRIVFEPVNEDKEYLETEDLKEVSCIKIVFIGDNH